MKTVNFHYKTFGKFIIRLPQYTFQDLLDLLESPIMLKERMSDPYVREAIFLASQVLDGEVQKYIDGRIVSDKERKRIKNAFMKYFTRLCSRCTPYGTFATCSCGIIGNKTSLSHHREIKRHVQFDTYFLSELIKYVSNIPEIRKRITYFSNTSIYSVGDKYRYIEVKSQEKRFLHQISSVVRNKFLDRILKKAVNGIPYKDIVGLLTKSGIDEDDAIEYVDDLIKNQLLQGYYESHLKESNILYHLFVLLNHYNDKQSDIKAIAEYVLESNDIFNLISEVNNASDILNLYKRIIEKSKSIPIPINLNNVFHVDTELEQSYNNVIGNDVVQDINDIIIFYCKTCSLQPDNRLNKFKHAFYERYEEQEISLLTALDSDIGIGYPPKHGQAENLPLLSSLKIPKKQQINNSTTINILLLKKLLHIIESGDDEIVFEDKDLNNIEIVNNAPNVIYCMFKLMKGQTTHFVVEPQIGTSATSILGRFSYMNKSIENLAIEIANKEQEYEKDAVYAEIKHIPSYHMGNINNIAHIWNYEVLLLTNTGIPAESKLPVSDLMLSVKRGNLVLRSKKLNRQIIPVLSCAHNFYLDTQPVYKFLCDLQFQHKPESLYFNWGNLRQILDYFPRVRYKNCILSLAFWVIKRSDISEISKNVDVISEIRRKRNLPRYVYLVDGDNTLFVDFESKDSTDAFVSTIKDRQEIVLKETLLDICDYENYPFANECIIPLYKQIN